jgi:glycosyltransferase involved in cell wall biosynthesis
VNIAIVTETFPPEVNGVAMTFGVIARELSRHEHSVTVYRPKRPDLAQRVRRELFAEVPLPGIPIPGYPQLRMGLPARSRLKRIWQAAPPDIVHVATEGPLGASAVSAALALQIPVTSSFHTNFHAYTKHYGYGVLRQPVLAWLRRVHNRTRRTYAPTAELCAELSANGFHHVAVMSRGVDTRDFHPDRRCAELRAEWGATPDTPVVLHVGRMAAEKNYELLFCAYAAMRAANPKTIFVLAGEGPLRARLERQHPECIFVGFFSRQEIGRYYASADIYIHASRTETFGNVLTEAMASELAVAGFDYAAAKQFLVHGINGLSVAYDDAVGLIDAAVLLATDDFLRLQLRRAARPAVERQSWETVIGRFESELAEIAGMARPQVEALAV